jgi:hypothetical protein
MLVGDQREAHAEMVPCTRVKPLARARARLEELGLLLLQDPELPNLAALCAGETVRGSWWGHRAGKLIFQVASELEDRPDVTTAKLVSGKVTFVDRAHFPLLIAVGSAKESWQLEGLTREAKRLLTRVESEGGVSEGGREAKLLEARLLVHTRQVHTESGKHALVLSGWAEFRKSEKIRRCPSAAVAKKRLEELMAKLGPTARAPWQD